MAVVRFRTALTPRRARTTSRGTKRSWPAAARRPRHDSRFGAKLRVPTQNVAAEAAARPEGWKRNGQLAVLGCPVRSHYVAPKFQAKADQPYITTRSWHFYEAAVATTSKARAKTARISKPGGCSPALPVGASGSSSAAEAPAPVRAGATLVPHRLSVNIFTFGMHVGEHTFGAQKALSNAARVPSY